MLTDTQRRAYRAIRKRSRRPARDILAYVRAAESPTVPVRHESGGSGTVNGAACRWWGILQRVPWRFVGYADQINRRIGHTGWYCGDAYGRTLRGIVFRLPARDGAETYLYGYESSVSECVLLRDISARTKHEAAGHADSLARVTAEREREYNNAWHEGTKHGDSVSCALDDHRQVLRAWHVGNLYARDMGLPASGDWPEDYVEARDSLRDVLSAAAEAEPRDLVLRDAYRDGFDGMVRIVRLGGTA